MNQTMAHSGARQLLRLFALVGAGVIAQPAHGQRVEGRIVSQHLAVQGAGIIAVDSLRNELARTTSGTDGRYVLSMPSGTRALHFAKIGFRDTVVSVVLLVGDMTIDVVLAAVPVTLDTLRAVAGSASIAPQIIDFEKRRRSRSAGRFLTDSVLRGLQNVSFASLVRTHFPGTKLVNYRAQEYLASSSARITPIPLDPSNFLHSPKACWVSIYLNGVAIYTGRQTSPPPMSRFTVMELAGVEYYSGGATPLEFRNIDNDCGTLLLWTRRGR